MDLVINEPWITSKVRCQNGYVYIDNAFWNSEKQQSDHKREYIGKYDGEKFTPNKTYFRLQAEYEQSLTASKTGPVPTDICLRQFYGSTYLLDQICQKTGIAADLGKCFASLAPQIMSIAYYLVLEEGQAMYSFVDGELPINIHMARISHPREVANSSASSPRKQRWLISSIRLNAME